MHFSQLSPLEVCYSVNSVRLAELNIGWLEDTGVAQLTQKAFLIPMEVCYSVNCMGLAELNIGWLQNTGVAELTGKLFLSPRGLSLCEQHGAG